jgi:hypothetical protein
MPKEKRKSHVWEYFRQEESTSKKYCKLCPYVDGTKSKTTTGMASHLSLVHGIQKPTTDPVESPGKACFSPVPVNKDIAWHFNTLKKSTEEWMTRQVVEDGISFHQLATSDFQAAAFRSMGLKHFKSHSSVANSVMSYIRDMKERISSMQLITYVGTTYTVSC